MPREHETTLTILTGLPGVGKSFVGREIASNENAEIHQSDRIRKEITDGEPTYDGDESQATYEEMFSRGKDTLESGQSVVLDATFTLEIGRQTAEKIAAETGVSFRIVHVTCDDETAKERIRSRNGVSDATVEVYEKLQDDFEAFERDVTVVDNSGSMEDTREKVSQL